VQTSWRLAVLGVCTAWARTIHPVGLLPRQLLVEIAQTGISAQSCRAMFLLVRSAEVFHRSLQCRTQKYHDPVSICSCHKSPRLDVDHSPTAACCPYRDANLERSVWVRYTVNLHRIRGIFNLHRMRRMLRFHSPMTKYQNPFRSFQLARHRPFPLWLQLMSTCQPVQQTH
jgi:hypothetical protein